MALQAAWLLAGPFGGRRRLPRLKHPLPCPRSWRCGSATCSPGDTPRRGPCRAPSQRRAASRKNGGCLGLLWVQGPPPRGVQRQLGGCVWVEEPCNMCPQADLRLTPLGGGFGKQSGTGFRGGRWAPLARAPSVSVWGLLQPTLPLEGGSHEPPSPATFWGCGQWGAGLPACLVLSAAPPPGRPSCRRTCCSTPSCL